MCLWLETLKKKVTAVVDVAFNNERRVEGRGSKSPRRPRSSMMTQVLHPHHHPQPYYVPQPPNYQCNESVDQNLRFRRGVYECHVSANDPECLARVDNAPFGRFRPPLVPMAKPRYPAAKTYADLSHPAKRFIEDWMREREETHYRDYMCHMPLRSVKSVPGDVILSPPALCRDPFVAPVTRVLSAYHPRRDDDADDETPFPNAVELSMLPGLTYLQHKPFVTAVVDCLFGSVSAFLRGGEGMRIRHIEEEEAGIST